MDISKRLRDLAAGELQGEIPAFEYSLAADEIDRLRANAARWDAIETLMILGDVELTQADDGGYCIAVEPVENIMATEWEGDTPEQAADNVVAQLMPPNAGGNATERSEGRVDHTLGG